MVAGGLDFQQRSIKDTFFFGLRWLHTQKPLRGGKEGELSRRRVVVVVVVAVLFFFAREEQRKFDPRLMFVFVFSCSMPTCHTKALSTLVWTLPRKFLHVRNRRTACVAFSEELPTSWF